MKTVGLGNTISTHTHNHAKSRSLAAIQTPSRDDVYFHFTAHTTSEENLHGMHITWNSRRFQQGMTNYSFLETPKYLSLVCIIVFIS
jgi:hypothetical protein